jgi:aspartyl protease family protein
MQSTGKMFLFWAVVIVLLMLVFTKWESQIFNPNQNVKTITANGIEQVTLKRNRSGHYVANGEINGVEVTFFVDTGATVVAIPAALEQKLNLQRGAAHPISTANGRAIAYSTDLKSISLGDIRIDNVEGSIVENMGDNKVLLGMSFLRHLNFSQQDNQLILSIP